MPRSHKPSSSCREFELFGNETLKYIYTDMLLTYTHYNGLFQLIPSAENINLIFEWTSDLCIYILYRALDTNIYPHLIYKLGIRIYVFAKK